MTKLRARLSANEVVTFIESSNPTQKEVIMQLRELVLGAVTDIEETVVWNSLSYHRPAMGGRVKGAVCLISPRSDCVQLGFIHGASIADPKRLLRGTGKAKRFVPIRKAEEIDRAALSDLVKAAGFYNPMGIG